MDIHDRHESSLFEEFIFLGDLVLYYCYVGGLDDSMGSVIDMRIASRD